MPGYDILEKNVKQGKEGIMVAVKQGICQTVEEISDDSFDNIFTVRIRFRKENVRLVTIHAPQETDSLESRRTFYDELAVQAERAGSAGDKVVILGDFNARINPEEETSSPNGKLLQNFLKENDLVACNFSPKARGVWTRIQTKSGVQNKSTIDYVLMKDEVLSLMEEMVVDEDKVYCPYRLKGKQGIVYSDHCAILLTLQLQTDETTLRSPKTKRWHFTEEGYAAYKIESIASMDVNWSPDTTQAYAFWVSKFEELLSKCFSKKTVKSGNWIPHKKKKTPIRDILTNVSKKGRIQRAIVKKYIERFVELEARQEAARKTAKLKETMQALTEDEKFSPNGFWKMKKSADKSLKADTSFTVMKDNGIEVTGAELINQAYKEEFQHRLRTRQPHDGWEEYVKEVNQVIRNWLKSESESTSSPPFTDEELDKVISRLKKGKCPGLDDYPPELFMYAGPGTRKALLSILNQIKTSRETPEQWNYLKIVTIYKNKGSKKVLKYYRGIFLALVVSKIFESLIKGRIEPEVKKIHLLQAGSRAGRRGADNLFLVRGCVDHHIATNQTLYMTAYDYEQAFDSLWVEKCILALKNLGVEKEMCQLIYSLNQKAKVVVKTPYGQTTSFTTEPIVKQGTVLGSILCSNSTGEYCGRNEGVVVGDMLLSSLLYVDDVLDLNETEKKRREAHNEAVIFSKENNLRLSGTKCYCMAINNKRELPESLPIDANTSVVPSKEIVYLGDVFNDLGNNDSLIKDRVRRAIKATVTITSLIKENSLGSHELNVWILLYHSLFIPTVLFNSETWSRLRPKDVDDLKCMQAKFLRKIFNLAESTPSSFLLLELGILPILGEIHKRQLAYLYRVLLLPNEDPVHQMYVNLQKFAEDGESNWWTQVKPLLHQYGLPEVDVISNLSKETFKSMVSRRVEHYWVQYLRSECAALKKTSNLEYDEVLKTKEYLKVLFPVHSKVILKSRCKTLDLKTHNTYKFEENDRRCRKCDIHLETLEHVVNCQQVDSIDLDIESVEEVGDLTRARLLKWVRRVTDFCELPVNNE